MRRHHRQDVSFVIKLHLIDTYLSIEAVNATRQVMTMIDNKVFAILLQDTVVTRTMNRLVSISLEDTTFIFIRSHRTYCRSSILHTIGIIMTRATAIGKIVHAVFLKDIRCLKEIGNLRIGNQLLLCKRFEISVQSGHTTTKTFIYAPCTEIEISRTVIIHKGLTVQRNRIMNKTVGHKYGICLS